MIGGVEAPAALTGLSRYAIVARMSAGVAGELAVVTGASSGIGRCVALLLAERRMRTVLIARREDALRRLAQECRAFAPSQALPLDLSDAPAVERTAAELDPLVLVNNAGFGSNEPFAALSLADHLRMMQVNYFASLALIRGVLPGMLRRRRGHVVNVASIASKMGPPGHSAYAPTKAAMVSLTQCLAGEHAGSGVHFSVVNPGIVDTEFFNDPSYAVLRGTLKRHAISPRRVARAVVSLLDRPRLEVCVPWHYRVVDVIRAISPSLLLRIVRANSRANSKR